MTETNECVTLFVRAGRNGQCMAKSKKAAAGFLTTYKIVPVNVSQPPEEFRCLGLRQRVPALYLGLQNEDPIDVANDIVSTLEKIYPGGVLPMNEEVMNEEEKIYPGGVLPMNEEVPEAEVATRDFFSHFCFYVRDVAKDASQLELWKIDSYLHSSGGEFLCGNDPSLLDCEVLPKLHQVCVAAAGIKSYQIPSSLTNLWRYLHTAYSEPAFIHSCPSDTEILLHWLEHIGESPSNLQKQQLQALNEKSPSYSFSVPVYAKPVILE